MQLQSQPSHPALAWAVTVAQAALLIVSVMLIFIPETRTPAMKAALLALALGTGTESILRVRRSGLLSMSLPQIHAGYRTGAIKGYGSTLLEFVSVIAAMVAMTMGYWAG